MKEKLKFKSRIDWFGLTIVLGPAIGVSIFTILSIIDTAPSSSQITQNIMLVISALVWLFAILSLGFTYYIIDDSSLTARMAYFKSSTIRIEDISGFRKQEFGKKILGLSKDILSIRLKNGSLLNISPKDIDRLINEIEKRRQH